MAKVKSKRSKPKKSAHLVLEGKIFFVERSGKKEISREELDGKVVLQCVLTALGEGLDLMEKDLKRK